MTKSISSSKPSFALVHDSYFIKGWAERMNIEIARILDADLVSSVFRPESYNLKAMGFSGKTYEVYPGFCRGMLGFLIMKFSFLLRARQLRFYDTVIFSNEATPARVWVRSDAKKVYYAHSISRHLFDQKEFYVSKVSGWFRPLFRLALSILKIWYVSDLRSMDLILANSQKNREFLQSIAPKVPVEVLYPPVNPEEFFPSDTPSSDGYFLSYARLTHAKRIDLIIRAFLLLPDKHLKIIYGKNDPQLEEFRLLAGDAKNIEFITLEDNSLLPEIVRRARAIVYVSKNEDFWLNTIESLASGVPVIAVREGGFLETMIDGVTGILLNPDPSPEEIAEAVNGIAQMPEGVFRNACIEHSKKFTLPVFVNRLRELVN